MKAENQQTYAKEILEELAVKLQQPKQLDPVDAVSLGWVLAEALVVAWHRLKQLSSGPEDDYQASELAYEVKYEVLEEAGDGKISQKLTS